MNEPNNQSLTIELKNRGERLEMHRIKTTNGTEELHLTGSLLAHREGPPPHLHFEENELGEVVSGVASAMVDGKRLVLKAGEQFHFPKGSVHNWWNDGDEELVMRGVASPVVDLDRYLQAVFEVLDAGRPNRPPIFYMAHLLYRHRKTQFTSVIPRAVQRVLLPVVVLLGTILGKYRGTSWPGCPSRCTGAPLATLENA
jgi:mannose-6-phosphate isomerase-like protein (cupin superfamily)